MGAGVWSNGMEHGGEESCMEPNDMPWKQPLWTCHWVDNMEPGQPLEVASINGAGAGVEKNGCEGIDD